MDQIFDRFERLFKSWVAADAESPGFGGYGRRASGDSDFDDAMAELDDYLDRGRTETEARERAQAAGQARRAREERGRGADTAGRGASTQPPQPIIKAYRSLGLAYGTPFPEVKARYKKLLMQNHPDRNSATPEQLRRSTEISAQINEAYHTIELWVEKGRVAE